ncbi:adipocyte enhancer-binding protein 1-like [Oncorhynchus masou masou]|uniref:adipocyte enhancer-binding protein 1-like n=1 Tax=Oncorhynchus masou masou TaxID=90313 RepID=UPI0031838353
MHAHVLSEETTVPWYEEYDYADLAAKQLKEEAEKARKEKEEKVKRLEEEVEEGEEERLRKIPVHAEPKKCPPLGLESHRVDDDQLLASSQSHHGFSAQRGRLNMQSSGNEEGVYGGAWCAEPEEKNHWFEVDARREVEFTGVMYRAGTQTQRKSCCLVSLHWDHCTVVTALFTQPGPGGIPINLHN